MNDSILDAVETPLVQVDSPPETTIAAKLESLTPGGSAKDRPALAMVEAAEDAGALSVGDRLVEPTSGNTGIGLAMVAAARGYELTVVMPASKSAERRKILRAYGAEIELVEGTISVAQERANELEAEPDTVQLRQFENEANIRAHRDTTGPEILDSIGDREIDAFVACVGTGGTIMGVGNCLREQCSDVEIVAVEPETNAVLSGEEPGEDSFQGMGPGFVSDLLDVSLLDSVETVGLEAAEVECRRLAREEGILVGQSSGAAQLGAQRVAKRLREQSTAEPLVVTVFPDDGERYLSAGTFEKN